MQQEKSPWLRLVHYLRPYWPGYVAGGFYLTLVEGTGQLLAAYFLKMLIDASVAADVPVLVHNLILFGLAFLVLSALLPFAIRLHARAVENATADLRQDVFDHMQTLPLAYHEQQHSGDTVSRLTTDVAQTKEAMGDTLLTFLMLSFEAIVAMVFIAIIDWRFVVIAITVGLLPLLFNRYAGRAVRQLSRQVQGSLASLNAHLKDMLVGMPVVKAYGLEQRFVADYAVANTTLREQGSTLARKRAGVVVGNDMLASATFMSVIAFGSYLILQGELTAGEAVAAVQLCNSIANPMRRLGDLWVTMQRSLGTADRVFAVLDMPSEQLTRNGTASADDLSMVSLQSVSFAYDENPVLSDISLSVAPVPWSH